ARKLGRPVKWIEERAENLQAGGHARDTHFSYEVGYRADGTVTALKVRITADVGAPATLVGWVMSFATAYCVPTVYRIENVEVELFSVVTNKCPWNSYRGFGKDAASFLMDRVMDHVARASGVNRATVRRKNYIPSDA